MGTTCGNAKHRTIKLRRRSGPTSRRSDVASSSCTTARREGLSKHPAETFDRRIPSRTVGITDNVIHSHDLGKHRWSGPTCESDGSTTTGAYGPCGPPAETPRPRQAVTITHSVRRHITNLRRTAVSPAFCRKSRPPHRADPTLAPRSTAGRDPPTVPACRTPRPRCDPESDGHSLMSILGGLVSLVRDTLSSASRTLRGPRGSTRRVGPLSDDG